MAGLHRGSRRDACSTVSPEGDGGPEGGDEEDRVQQTEFRDGKFQKIGDGWLPRTIHSSVGGDMGQGDPAVLRIPDPNREGAEEGNGQREVRPGTAQMN